jgi:hypothetical protein
MSSHDRDARDFLASVRERTLSPWVYPVLMSSSDAFLRIRPCNPPKFTSIGSTCLVFATRDALVQTSTLLLNPLSAS